MKKSFLSALIVTTTILVPSLPSLAKNCPTIPEKLEKVTVKDNQATLRTEPKKNSDRGSKINQGDKLKVIDINPIQDSEGNDHCWYQVSPINNNPENKQYWIAGIGLDESFSWQNAVASSPSPLTSPTPPEKPNSPNDNKFLVPWPIWLLAPIGIIVIGLLVFEKVKRSERFKSLSSSSFRKSDKTNNLSSSNLDTTITKSNTNVPSLDESVHLIASIIQEYLPQIVKLTEKITNQDKEIGKIKSKVTKQDKEISELKSTVNEQKVEISKILEFYNQNITKTAELNSDLQQQPLNQEDFVQSSLPNQAQEESSSSSSDEPNTCLAPKVREIVNQFNNKNEDYFLGLDRKFLKLNEKSIHAQPSTGGSPIVQLIPSDDSQEFYFTIEVEKENWLFPNLNSSHFKKIMKGLNTSIFKFDSNSEPLKLLRPAKLQEVSLGLWEIEEPGEFTQ
jgi:hypothetical protein